ncbi:MAG: hypothetical protein L6R41_003984 [Letrouitia leprolyta]|nr:MAG: hypothetical protein L6R41_003984 [Letrouitia leprolyta]
MTDFYYSKKAISRKTGKPTYGGHAQLWVDGTSTDGPMIIELGYNPAPRAPGSPPKPQYGIRSKDLGVENTGKPITPYPFPGMERHIVTEGQTLLKNREMFDHQAGTGLIADAWLEDPIYRMGTGSKPNTCYDLLVRVLQHMHLDLDPLTKRLFENSTDYYTSHSRTMVQRVEDVVSVTMKPAGDGRDEMNTRVFNVDWDYNPNAPELIYEKSQYIRPQQTLVTALNQRDPEIATS